MTVRFYGKAETAANAILKAFQNPGELPKALAPIFIKRRDDVPCRQWSWSNQLITALAGYSDARGFRQWQKVGRHVKKGEKSFTILSPITKKIVDKTTQDERFAVVGFKGTAVFGLSQTDGEPLPPPDPEVGRWIESLPMLDVAKEWGLSVEAYSGQQGRALGRFAFSGSIALGVENLSTWAHEMIHAADHRLGNLNERGQHWRSETVAELGSAILLSVLGDKSDADLGGCWDYVASYAKDASIEPIVACQRVLKRTCDAVALILDTAESLKPEPAESFA